VTTPTTPIYDLKDPPPPPPPPPPAPIHVYPSHAPLPPRRRMKPFRFGGQVLTWAMVIIFLVGGGRWALRAGMQQRQEMWRATRSIRFKMDISRGFQFGNDVLRFAESDARLQPGADSLAEQSTSVLRHAGLMEEARPDGPDFRRLTTGEVIHGIVAYVDDIVQNRSPEDYDLDYLPLRLAVVTLWVRHAQRLHPEMDHFPTEHFDDTDLPRGEDVAEPILEFNAWCAAAGAVAMFLLVWVWVRRSFQPAKPLWIGRWWPKRPVKPPGEPVVRKLSMRWTVPHGIFAFMIATGGFWYSYFALVRVPPRPVPAVGVVEIDPGDGGANVMARINAQNQDDTRWHIEFGPTAAYGHRTDPQPADATLEDQPLSARLQPLGNGQMVHFRVCAQSPAGSIASDDFSFVNHGAPIAVNSAAVGGIDWPSWTVWIRLLALFIVMVVSAQLLPPVHRGWACGAVAAMLVWCDPVLLMDSHVWPQWDVWIVPFFLFAALLASVNWWMMAGVLLGVGAMFKGQMLLAGPILLLWPLFEGRWGAMARIIIGFVLGIEIVTWPWIINSPSALHYVIAVGVAACIALAASFLRPMVVREFRYWVVRLLFGENIANVPARNFEQALVTTLLVATAALAGLTIATALVFHGVVSLPSNLPPGTLGLFLLLVLLTPWLVRRKSLGYWLIAVLVAGAWIASEQFGGSYSWATLGFGYGSIKHDEMQMSVESFSNLSSLLKQTYGWDIHDAMGTMRFTFTTPGPWRIGRLAIPAVTWIWSSDLDVKQTMSVLYGICLVVASAAAALHSRRNDRRFLVTLCIPWLIFPMVMCQMGGRYPIWALAVSAAVVAVSLELTLLHVVFAAVCFGMITRQLAMSDTNRWPQVMEVMNPTYPGIAWLLMGVTAIFFVAALVPSRRKFA